MPSWETAYLTNRRKALCGRFTLKTPLGKWLFEFFGQDLTADLPVLEPRYNIAPTQPILIARRDPKKGLIELDFARWGFVPAWAKEVRASAPLINARSETLATKPTFQTAFDHHRCAVIADGYYEWQVLDKKRKQPFWIHRPDESPFLMAGLVSINRNIDAEQPLQSVAIVTTSSEETLSVIHDRMPVVLESAEKIQRWLSNGPLEEHRFEDLNPAPKGYFTARSVSSRVGNPKHDDSHCLDPAPILWQRTLGIDEPVAPDT